MKAFSNDNIKDKLCGGCECTGFSPSVTFTYNAGAKTITATDASVYPAGTDRQVVKLTAYDKFGNKAISSISAADGDDAVTFSVAALDPSEGIDLFATVVTDGSCISDGHASNIQSSGSIGSWDKDNDAIAVGSSESSS